MSTETDTTTSRNGVAIGAIIAAIAALVLGIFATGTALSAIDDDGPAAGGGDGAPATAAVSLTEFAIGPASIAVAEGGSLAVDNDGAAPHNLKVKDTEVGTAELQPGESATLDVASLAAGSYTVFCDIPGHEAAGMSGTLTIGGAGGDAPAAADTHLSAEQLRANYEASVQPFLDAATTGTPNTTGQGNQLLEPVIEADGTKVFELTIDETQWEVAPGEFVEATAYNGMVPGPIIKVDVGDRLKVIVNNQLDDQATTLHPHGVKLHPFAADGVGMISMEPIMPGETWEITYVAESPSVGMYHGHDNGVHQVPNGAFGAFLVGDMPLPAVADNVVAEHVMVLNDAGNIGLTLNGKSFPATEPYVLAQGQQMVLHYYNEGLAAHPMHLHNNKQLVVARDGFPLESPFYVDTLNIAPGERYTVVVFAEKPGAWVFHCHILTHVERTDGSVFGMFTAMIVTEPEPAADDEASSDT